jgi:hypothetical protein
MKKNNNFVLEHGCVWYTKLLLECFSHEMAEILLKLALNTDQSVNV